MQMLPRPLRPGIKHHYREHAELGITFCISKEVPLLFENPGLEEKANASLSFIRILSINMQFYLPMIAFSQISVMIKIMKRKMS